MNTTENFISTECPATAPQPINQLVKPVKFPAQPQEWKIVSLRECPTPDTMQQCETPDQVSSDSGRASRPVTTSIVLNIGFPPVVSPRRFKPSAHPNIRWWRIDHECRLP
jgi:hypothetical protein